MAQRLATILTDKASTNPVTTGLALTNELANQAFPEGSSKRWTFGLTNAAGTVGTGVTQLEIFIDSVPNFRIRPADTSMMMLELIVCYVSSVAGTAAVHTLRAAIVNRNGAVSVLADATNTKMPSIAASTVGLTIVANQIQVLCTGVAGDTNGRWKARATITEVTDLG